MGASTPPFNLTTAIPAFIEALHSRLQQAGVDSDQPIVLKDDGWGGVVVDGDHPDRLMIEEMFVSDANLRADFQQIAAAATAERDRAAAISGPSLGEFRLQIDGAEVSVGFE